jgi:hypothetical protein
LYYLFQLDARRVSRKDAKASSKTRLVHCHSKMAWLAVGFNRSLRGGDFPSKQSVSLPGGDCFAPLAVTT